MRAILRTHLLPLSLAHGLLLSACQSVTAGAEPGLTMTHQHHSIDYIEFAVSDMAEAQRFYAQAFGWSFTDYGPEYSGIQRPSGDGEVGGLRLDTSVVRGGPLVVLYSSDLEASVRAVQEAGGSIVLEPFAFPGGRRFHFLDPAGNELAVWGP